LRFTPDTGLGFYSRYRFRFYSGEDFFSGINQSWNITGSVSGRG